MSKSSAEDLHFYFDNAPPGEALAALRALSREPTLSSTLPARVKQVTDYQMQADYNYTPRRLFDLGVADQIRLKNGIGYCLTDLGEKLQRVSCVDPGFTMDLLHYLHYSTYLRRPTARKYLWSYRRCCDAVWNSGEVLSPGTMAAQVQSDMMAQFSTIDVEARLGSRFNKTAVSAVYTWLRALDPSPIGKIGSPVQPRVTRRAELVLLAIDDTYRSRGYGYGDPVLLHEDLTRAIRGVFLLDQGCFEGLLRSAESLTSALRVINTLSGPAIRLMAEMDVAALI